MRSLEITTLLYWLCLYLEAINNLFTFRCLFRTLTVNGWSATELSLSALRKFTRYEVRVRAFNGVAAGPASTPVSATTLEGGKWIFPLFVLFLFCSFSAQLMKVSFSVIQNMLLNLCFFSVPESHPTRVTCSALSSSSMKVTWNPPPLGQHGGIIQGYKVIYTPLTSDHGDLIFRIFYWQWLYSLDIYIRSLYTYIFSYLSTQMWERLNE